MTIKVSVLKKGLCLWNTQAFLHKMNWGEICNLFTKNHVLWQKSMNKWCKAGLCYRSSRQQGSHLEFAHVRAHPMGVLRGVVDRRRTTDEWRWGERWRESRRDKTCGQKQESSKVSEVSNWGISHLHHTRLYNTSGQFQSKTFWQCIYRQIK